MAITEENWQESKANLFPGAILAIADRQAFPWHMHAHQANSSQALAIGVLGIIKASPDAHVICGEIAEKLGLSSWGLGPWRLSGRHPATSKGRPN